MSSIITISGSILVFLALLSLTAIIFGLRKFISEKSDVTKLFTKENILIISGFPLFTIFLTTAITIFAFGYQGAVIHHLLAIGSGFVFSLSFVTFITTFIIHFYKFNVVKYKQKISKLILVASLPLAIFSLFGTLDGFSLLGAIGTIPKAITFGPISVTFYAIVIISGAIITYFIADHEFYKKYKRHGILENVFYIAFPMGIVGARLFYVIGEWNKPQLNGKSFAQDFLNVFRVWDGGLTILGGALVGAIAGILFMYFRRKKYSLSFAIDMIVPAILVAQALGRWGNFFNQEVYGAIGNPNDYFFVPEFVKQNMQIYGSGGIVAFRVPLFYIEALSNLAGFFIIRYAVGEGLKKFKQPLDMGLLYVVWYGLTRVIMEPLRDNTYQMGQDNKWSFYFAIGFVVFGIIGIIGNHVVRYVLKKQKTRDESQVN